MNSHISQKLTGFNSITIFSILILYTSCNKDIKRPVIGKPATGITNIIYTDVNPDTTVSAASYDLDLNQDGIADFKVYAATENGRCAPGVTVTKPNVSYVRVGSYSGNSFGDTALVAGGAIYPVPFDSGREINQDLVTWSGTSMVAPLNLYNSCSTGYGLWLLDDEKYLPLRLVVGSSAYFGWVRISIHLSFSASVPSFHFTIKDYAYNSIPNQPILAGQTQ